MDKNLKSHSFSEIYQKASRPIISFELFPPRDSRALDQTKQRIKKLEALKPDYMTVTYGAGGSKRDLSCELLDYIHQECGLPAIAHLTCVGHTRDEIDGILEDLKTRGIDHILALRGDTPDGQEAVKVSSCEFDCARDLAAHIRARGEFSIAVAGYPEPHPDSISEEKDLEYLASKVDAGAEVIITQLFFDTDIYFRFVEKVRSYGITVPIVPGIMPIAKYDQVTRFVSMCGATIPEELMKKLERLKVDPPAVTEFGTEYATAMANTLLEGGAPGVHFYTLNRCKQTELIVKHIL